MRNIVCFSGGYASAQVAIAAVERDGRKNTVLVNHDISSQVEHKDIKRFKSDISDYLRVPITYANRPDFEEMTPIKCMIAGGGNSFGLTHCTKMLKTEPFHKWLKSNYNEGDTILYGFDLAEPQRIQRRSQMLGAQGYKTDFPLAYWHVACPNLELVGIKIPITYRIFKHANCIGCLKAGRQHWYIVYCLYPEIFQEAIEAEQITGSSVIKGIYLKDLIPKYEEMKLKGICPTDRGNSAAFWAKVNKACPEQQSLLPCDCALF